MASTPIGPNLAPNARWTPASQVFISFTSDLIPNVYFSPPNLIPPFILKPGGVTVNDVPKIYCDDPTIDDHCIIFPNIELCIPLQLIGTFSYFHSRMPTANDLYDCDKIFLIPDSIDWNPHCLLFEIN